MLGRPLIYRWTRGISVGASRTKRGPLREAPSLYSLFARRALGRGQEAFALGPLASQFPRPPHRLGLLSRALFRRFLVIVPTFHFAERAFALHLLFKRLQRLVDVIVANKDLNDDTPSSMRAVSPQKAERQRGAALAKRGPFVHQAGRERVPLFF